MSTLRARRMVTPLLAGAALAVVVALLVLVRGGNADGPAAAFSLSDVRGGADPVALAGRGARPVVLNFFASWCVPCRKELPMLEKAHRRTAGDVAFIGVAVNDSRSAARETLDRAGVSYPAGADPDEVVAGSYRVRGMPTTVFIGADGRALGRVEGELTSKALDRWLDRLARSA